MLSLKQMLNVLRCCYGCDKIQSCVGCPRNGCKAEILNYLSNLNGAFSSRECDLLLLCIRNCIESANLSALKYQTPEIYTVMSNFKNELQELGDKVSKNRKIVTCGECSKCGTEDCHFFIKTPDCIIGPQESFFCADGVQRKNDKNTPLDY